MDNHKKESNTDFIIPEYKDGNVYSGLAMRSVLAATSSSNSFALGRDFEYYSTFKGYQDAMLAKGLSILSLMTSILPCQNIRETFLGKQLEEKFDLLEQINDIVLENVSNCTDEVCGLKKSEEELTLAVKPQITINTCWNKKQFTPGSQSCTLLTAKNISRPQLSFKEKIDNSSVPFVPIIKDKPNSIKPLAIILEKDNYKEEYCHPYEWEIEKFTVPEEYLQEIEPTLPKAVEETPFFLINTETQLKHMCEKLKHESALAVDLEHHSYRSFQGFTCLIQVSTKECDYVIDAIELRSALHILNEIFTDPRILKVFHGADMDIVWLQRDFGVYVVNLFDTGQAARVLHFAHLSLSYLLKHYCKLDIEKKFQLADWRIRPLPADMLKYAREDTHYLLYVYECLRDDLIRSGNEMKNLIRSAFERSRLICLKKYEKPIFSEDKYIELYKKSKKSMNYKQLLCLKELFCWRDRIARENDESLAYVLPNHMLLQIAETLPREQQGVLACCNPIPPLVRQQLNEMHAIVLKAARSSTSQLAALELQQKAQSVKVDNQIDISNPISCIHDILHVEEKKIQSLNSSNLSTSLPFIMKDSPVIISSKPPSLTALFENYLKNNQETSSNKVSDILSKLYSPFQRYEMTQRLQTNHETTPKSTAEQKTAKTKQKSRTKSRPHLSEEVSDGDIDDISICEDQSTTNNLSTPNTSKSENFSSTPIRQKKKKRKAQPDVSLTCTPISQGPRPKKSKSPEHQAGDDEETFTPYDYNKTDLNQFSGEKKSKNVFKPGAEHNFKGPGKHHGRSKKHFKQGTFGNASKPEKKKWPQNN